jgi:hypothetical protein
MKKNDSVSVPKVDAVQKAVFSTVFAILYNPAKPRDPAIKSDSPSRDDVPWVVIIPDLSVVATVLDKDGDPVCGHVNPQYASAYAGRLYNRLVQNPELLDSYRKNPDVYPINRGYMGKMIPIQFEV